MFETIFELFMDNYVLASYILIDMSIQLKVNKLFNSGSP